MKARFGDFEIDSQTRQLTRGDEAIHLSPKAFAVLCALIEQRPNVVPKADLFGQIWPDVFVVEGNLNVLVGEQSEHAMTANFGSSDGVIKRVYLPPTVEVPVS